MHGLAFALRIVIGDVQIDRVAGIVGIIREQVVVQLQLVEKYRLEGSRARASRPTSWEIPRMWIAPDKIQPVGELPR